MKIHKPGKNVPHQYNRREAFGQAAKGFVGINIGLGLGNFIGSLTPEQMIFKRIIELVTIRDPQVFAQAIEGEKHPFIQICHVDKVVTNMVFPAKDITGNVLNGIEGSGQNYKGASIAGKALDSKDWRGIELTALWADILEGMPSEYSLAFLPQTSSLVGGHNLNTANLGTDKGGANYVIDKAQKSGVLGFTGFAIQAAANNSARSASAPGGVPMTTYDSVLSLRSTLNRAFKALLDPATFAAKFRTSLDRLALDNDQTFRQMQALRDSIEPTLAPLLVAANEGDYVDQQLAAAEAMIKTGLSTNILIATATADTNGGGDLTRPGGAYNVSPHVAHAQLAHIYKTISQKMPGAVTALMSDGGRSSNNGDSAGMLSIVSGPSDIIQNGVFGRVPTLNELGNQNAFETEGENIKMSNGSTVKFLEQKHVLAAAVESAMGIDTEVTYPIDFLKKKKA